MAKKITKALCNLSLEEYDKKDLIKVTVNYPIKYNTFIHKRFLKDLPEKYSLIV